MPSGATHDRITLWGLPVVTGITLGVTRNSSLTLLVAGGYLFSGLMLSPDLDLRSRPYQRWGWFRWIWIPYQKTTQHRSVLSHGLLIGTTVRVIYLIGWLAIAFTLLVTILTLFQDEVWDWREGVRTIGKSLFTHRWYWLALFVGLELGAISHILSDFLISSYKRYQRFGWKGLQPKKRRTQRKTASRSRKSTKNPPRLP